MPFKKIGKKLSKGNLKKIKQMMEDGVEPEAAYKYMKSPLGSKKGMPDNLPKVNEKDVMAKGQQGKWKREIDQDLRE